MVGPCDHDAIIDVGRVLSVHESSLAGRSETQLFAIFRPIKLNKRLIITPVEGGVLSRAKSIPLVLNIVDFF